LKTNFTIKKVSAAVLLLFFVFSITPKKILHDIIASHKDTRSVLLPVDTPIKLLSKAGFHCQCDNLVAGGPFLQSNSFYKEFIPSFFCIQQSGFVNQFCFSSRHVFALRGPPNH